MDGRFKQWMRKKGILEHGGMPDMQIDGYKAYSDFKDLPYIDIDSDTIDMDGLAYDKLMLMGDNGVTKIADNNSGIVRIPGANTIREVPVAQNGIDIQQAEVQDDPQSFYDYARGEYDYFINNPDMWNQDPDMMNPDGTFKFCLDCINKDYTNPDHLRGIVQLMNEGLTEGPHNTEWANELDQFKEALIANDMVYPEIKQEGGVTTEQPSMLDQQDSIIPFDNFMNDDGSFIEFPSLSEYTSSFKEGGITKKKFVKSLLKQKEGGA